MIEKFPGIMIEYKDIEDINDLKILGMLVYIRYIIQTNKNISLTNLKEELKNKFNISPRFISKYLTQLFDLDLLCLEEEK